MSCNSCKQISAMRVERTASVPQMVPRVKITPVRTTGRKPFVKAVGTNHTDVDKFRVQ